MMSSDSDREATSTPAWRLPEGVDAPLWQYAHEPRLADEEDAYFEGHPLFETDARLLAEWFAAPADVIDLGCGAGRHAVAFARRGCRVAAVDLSRALLAKVGQKAAAERLDIRLIHAGLCDLGAIADSSFDVALLMFSTLGMVRGAAARRRVLAEAARVLRPGGRLAIHAHNLWLNARNPAGLRWLLVEIPRILARRPEAADRRMTYRGIPNLAVHLYRFPELRRELHAAGFVIEHVEPIHEATAATIPLPRLLPSLRAGGWIIRARKTAT